jgi:nucleotide-binding universal stress UspA family protein
MESAGVIVRTGLRRAFLGSVAARVAATALCAVLTVHA